MPSRWSLSRLVLLALAGGTIAGAAIAGRGLLERWTRERVRSQLHARIHALPEARAAHLVRELASLDADAPAAIVPLLADPREPVVAAAEETLLRLVEDWRGLPPREGAVRLARLARELSIHGPHFPEHRRTCVRRLATRLLAGPVDQQLVADCEVVLRLPGPRWSDGPHRTSSTVDPKPGTISQDDQAPERVASQPPPVTLLPAPPADTPAPAPIASEPSPPPEPRIYGSPLEPERLIDASQERPIEPRQLRRPKAMKIEG